MKFKYIRQIVKTKRALVQGFVEQLSMVECSIERGLIQCKIDLLENDIRELV